MFVRVPSLSSHHHLVARLLVALMLCTASVANAANDEITLYSARSEPLIKPLLDRFSERHGIEVNLITGKAGVLIERLKHEPAGRADVLLSTDAGRLYYADSLGLFQPIDSEVLQSRVPAHYRSTDNTWFALSVRSRVIVYSLDRVSRNRLSTYEDLTDRQWRGRICLRSSNNIYNQSLLASLIAHLGPIKAERWAEGMVQNMARRPKGNDRAQILAVAAGVCDLTLVNTYYVGLMKTSPDPAHRRASDKVGVFYPNQTGTGQAGRGAHMNVGGAGVVRGSKSVAASVKLLEFLVSDEAQTWYAQVNHEYPVVAGIPPSPVIASFGSFVQDDLPVQRLGELNRAAVRIFDRAGWR